MTHSTHIEISRSAIQNNIAFIQKLVGPHVIVSSVVKGNAYGHGIETIVPQVNTAGVKHFSVFNAEEAIRVKQVVGDDVHIMIMGMITKDQMKWVIENSIEFYVFDMRRLQIAEKTARELNKVAIIHLDMETGMNRTGVPVRELKAMTDFIASHSNLKLKGICTHLAGAENIANYYRIKKQISVFRKAIEKASSLGFPDLTRHAACSAAVIKYPAMIYDMARVGIMQYGFFPSNEVMVQYMMKTKNFENPLQQVISWKSRVMGIKEVKKGEFIGYGTSYFANSDMRIATIPVGYSYGFNRSLSNLGRVLINGKYASVTGLVNMSMMSVDITDIPDAEAGDEVVIIGRQGGQELTVSSFSDFSNQINYELLTRLPQDIPRIIVD